MVASQTEFDLNRRRLQIEPAPTTSSVPMEIFASDRCRLLALVDRATAADCQTLAGLYDRCAAFVYRRARGRNGYPKLCAAGAIAASARSGLTDRASTFTVPSRRCSSPRTTTNGSVRTSERSRS